jgi:Tol biopolymer transport system component
MKNRRRDDSVGIRMLTLLVGALIVTGACTSPGPRNLPLSGPVPEAPGLILYGKQGSFWTVEPATQRTQVFMTFPNGSFVGQPAVSPDATRLAYSGLIPEPDRGYDRGADISVIDLMSRKSRVVAAATRDVTYSEPAWSPDGRSLFVTREARGQPARVERVAAAGSSPTFIVAGHSPTLSRAGRLAYLTGPRDGRQTLWLAASRHERARPIVEDREFLALSTPRFAPHTTAIVFAAVGGPRSKRGAAPLRRTPTAWPGMRTAAAHGGPRWELWLLAGDGSLRRLTDLQEDFLVPAWSADGRWIACVGEQGIYLLELSSGRLLRLVAETSHGGLTWMGGTR